MKTSNNPEPITIPIKKSQIIDETIIKVHLLFLKYFKDYYVEFSKNTEIKKKIRYNNPDDYNKILRIINNSDIIQLRTPELHLEHKSNPKLILKISFKIHKARISNTLYNS